MISKGSLVITPAHATGDPECDAVAGDICLVISDPYPTGGDGTLIVDLFVQRLAAVRPYYLDKLEVITQ